MWKIRKIVSKSDYNYAVVPEHPFATKNGYVLEHRIVMENHLDRLLNPNELVHHKDEHGKHNDIENLEVKVRGEHARFHGFKKGRLWMSLKCPQCKRIFEREKRQTFLSKKGVYTCCSRKCHGVFVRNIQLKGRTAEVEQAISENLVREYRSYDNFEQTLDKGMRRGHTPVT